MSSNVDDTSLLRTDGTSSTLGCVAGSLSVVVDCSPIGAMSVRDFFRRRDGRVTWPDEPAGAAPFAATAGVLRLGVVGAIALNALFPLIELWRTGLFAGTSAVRYAAVATAATIALHLRHVAAGLRGERPRAGAWTLGVLVIVNAA